MGWLRKIFNLDEKPETQLSVSSNDETIATFAVRNLAKEICIDRIASAIAKCEFRTYRKHKEVKSGIYYALNIQPNPNENATAFWQKFIHKLYHDGAVLVFQDKDNGGLFIADSYTLDDTNVMKEQTFKDIQVGEFKVSGEKMSQVLYFPLRNGFTQAYLDQTLAIQTTLMASAVKSYRQSNGAKYVINKRRQAENLNGKDSKYADAMNAKVKSFIDSDSAALTMYEGTSIQQLDSSGTSKDTRDVKALLDDVLEITSKAFLIPTNIATGEVTDTSKAVDDFLTFCLDGIVELIQDELNAKLFTKFEYLRGTQIKINTQTIKHIDILDMASAVDKLVASGVLSVNDILRILGDEPIDEEWADVHFMTKNYSPMGNLVNPVEPPGDGEVDGRKEEEP